MPPGIPGGLRPCFLLSVPGFSWVSPGIIFVYSVFCKKVQHSLQQPLFSTTMLGPYSSLLFQPKKPPRIPMQGEFLRHHLLCNQLDSESQFGSVWFRGVTSEVRILSEGVRNPLQTGSSKKENLTELRSPQVQLLQVWLDPDAQNRNLFFFFGSCFYLPL